MASSGAVPNERLGLDVVVGRQWTPRADRIEPGRRQRGLHPVLTLLRIEPWLLVGASETNRPLRALLLSVM